MWLEFTSLDCLGLAYGVGNIFSFTRRRSFDPPMNPSLDSSKSNDCPALVWIGRAFGRPWPQATSMEWFGNSDDFLLSHQAFDFPFYVVCVEQHGVSGSILIRRIRRRSSVGILAISNLEESGFVAALEAGADMVLRQDVPDDQLRAAIQAIRRRSGIGAQAGSHTPRGCWRIRRSCRRPMARGYRWGTVIWQSCVALFEPKAVRWCDAH